MCSAVEIFEILAFPNFERPKMIFRMKVNLFCANSCFWTLELCLFFDVQSNVSYLIQNPNLL